MYVAMLVVSLIARVPTSRAWGTEGPLHDLQDFSSIFLKSIFFNFRAVGEDWGFN
jgi:hypothetical protein